MAKRDPARYSEAMEPARILRLYYDDELLARAGAGQHNYTNRLRTAFGSRGVEVKLCRNSDAARLLSAGLPGYSLFHMDDPFHPRALTTRLAYFYPFWRIEASAKRWEWGVARSAFRPDAMDRDLAERFVRRQRRVRLPGRPTREGYVYVPLQGRLTEHRSFQTMSPLDMLGETLAHSGRRVVAGLHPKEVYSEAELEALHALVAANPRLELSAAPAGTLVLGCDYVVTQNSSVALLGYIAGKAAVLFGQIDFHHIALNVGALGVAEAFARAPEHRPDFDAYLYWFLKATAINAGAEEAERQILDAVRRHGWVF
ncbi:hypothetical protein [Oceaniglobus roseus]|uniref:hypothetical protein n=1 Tax=Oceaniglobus roseus TaxID=1737570 RepID=UPI000C7ED1F7|nr:hypothetical protein [Kandeliimicrobium roseum]